MIARFKSSLTSARAELWRWVKPEALSWKGAGNAALLVGAIVYAAWLLFGQSGPLLMRVAEIAFFAALGFLAVLGMQLVSLLIGWLNHLPYTFRWKWLGGLFLIIATLINLQPQGFLLFGSWVMLSAALLGGCALVLWRAKNLWRANGFWRVGRQADEAQPPLTTARRTALWLGVFLGAAGLLAATVWAAGPGLDPRPQAVAAQTGAPLARVSLENPAAPGPYGVATLTYGSGSDRYRPEYGAQAVIKTQPVDGSFLLDGTWNGPPGAVRPLLWGFGPRALPLNGRVWYPHEGLAAGPYPLVLVVHGNHNMADFSDPGYAYLGELLASRGYIVASVDMNFLNGSFIDLLGPTNGENDARGWLLLEHLRAWHAWNQEVGNPFYQKVDTGNIALIGHSRGGEAVALAAAFNRLPFFPENAGQAFHYNYKIRSVVAIAPIDGQYWPAGRGTRLEDVNYLVLQGTHDADVSSFDGINQYERVLLSPAGENFKAAVYIYRANHGQFNSTWGDRDYSPLASEFINRKALLSKAEQQQVASVYISAFLEASLRGQDGYKPLFQDARAAGEDWLPHTIYISRFAESGETVLADFEEDINLTTASQPGSTIAAEGLALWQEGRLQTRWGSGETGVVTLGWDDTRVASYTIRLPRDAAPPTADSLLVFSLADALRDPHPKNAQNGPGAGPRQPLDLSVVLIDANGRGARLPLATRMPVQPQIMVDVWKASFIKGGAPSEAVLQSYVFALSEFAAANPDFDPTQVRAVRFVFDQTKQGSVILDGVGFRQ